jgi:hypothetical protein
MIKATCLLVLSGFASIQQPAKIKWRKVVTSAQAQTAMELLVPAESTFSSAVEILTAQKTDYFGRSGDTLLHFHSPYVPVRRLSWVARKWMYQLHFAGRKLVSVEVEEGLMGP